MLLACIVSASAHAGSFVWRVAGTENTVYLAGSMHLLPERAYPLPQAYEDAYADSGLLVVEADQDRLQADAVRQTMLAAAHYREGGLVDHLDAPMLARTREVLDRTGLSIDRMNAYRPWFVSMAIEVQAYQAQGFRPDLGLDGYFHDRAVRDDKPILPLQTIAAHLAVFTDMPATLSRDQLAVTLDNADELDTSPEQIYRYWQSGDIAGFAQSVNEQADAYPALYDRLIFDRNTQWLATITAVLNSPDNAMVLVGAAHLVGPRGLVALLQSKGYRVERMD
ncbi:TraB/GumN family protein [Salinisphaera aquimarina]